MRENQIYVERLNIPVSNSLLHKQEYNNTLIRLHTDRRRATTEKHKNKNKIIDIYNANVSELRSYHTDYVK